MRRYETIVIINPDVSEEDRGTLFGKFKDLISQQGGELLSNDEWGVQRLAYEIKKKTRGYYIRLDYCGTGKLVAELERSFRIDDRVLKYLTVLLEKDVNVETIKEGLSNAAAGIAPSETSELPPVQAEENNEQEQVIAPPETVEQKEDEDEDDDEDTEDTDSEDDEDEEGEEK